MKSTGGAVFVWFLKNTTQSRCVWLGFVIFL